MTRPLLDSYHVRTWLPGNVIAWLNARFPDDELDVQVQRALSDAMERDRNRQRSVDPKEATSIQVLHLVPQPKPITPDPALTPPTIAPKPEQKATLTKPPRHPSKPPTLDPRPALGQINLTDPVSQLQQLCQKHKAPLPTYDFNPSATGFQCDCQCRVLGKAAAASATGASKKIAKREAAIATLHCLGFC